jgi:hypothetical protein
MPLILNDLDVEYLSGFTTAHLLTPKNSSFPIILNFGEIHANINHPCTEPNAIGIPRFLTQLNILGSKFHTEIFSEDFMNHDLLVLAKDKETTEKKWIRGMENSEADGTHFGALGLFNNSANTLSCYYKDLKKNHINIFKAKCEYPNIIWQYSDARKTFRSRSTNTLYRLENVGDAYSAVQTIIGKLAFLNDDYFNKYPPFLVKPDKLDTLEKKYNFANEIIHGKHMNFDLSTLMEVMQLIIDFHESPGKAAETIVDVPIVMKQFRKQIGIKVENFKRHVKTYIEYILSEYDSHDKELLCYLDFMKALVNFVQNDNFDNFQNIVNATNAMLTYKPLATLRGKYQMYEEETSPTHLVTAPASIIMDIYFVLRILNKTKKDLIFNLAGYKHTEHISHFLTEILNLYDVDVFQSKDKKKSKSQCIHFNKNINLNEMLIQNKQKSSKKYRTMNTRRLNTIMSLKTRRRRATH